MQRISQNPQNPQNPNTDCHRDIGAELFTSGNHGHHNFGQSRRSTFHHFFSLSLVSVRTVSHAPEAQNKSYTYQYRTQFWNATYALTLNFRISRNFVPVMPVNVM